MTQTMTIILAVVIGFVLERVWDRRKLYRWKIKKMFEKKLTEEERKARKEYLEKEYPSVIKVPSFEECMIEVFTSWGIDYRSLMLKEKNPSESRSDDTSK